MTTKKWIKGAVVRVIALALVLNLVIAVPRALAGQPTDDVKCIIDEVMGILHNPAYNSPGQKATRLRLIEQSALRRLDYHEMSKRCLEQTWNTLTQAQRTEFIRMFTELLKASYADKLDDFAKSTVTYQGETQKGDCAEVHILVLRTNDKIPVKFQLLKGPQCWMIYDLIIEDVSLTENLRTEFGRIIRASSFSGLLKCMQLKLQSNMAEYKKSCPPPRESSPKGRGKGGS